MTPARILIVEDDRIVARDIEQQLVQMGHDVVGSTARGEEAIYLVQQLRPQVVLMDIRLDGVLDGVDTAQQIRTKFQTPVIFLTAFADDETVQRASLTEPFGFLLKPFDTSQLRTAVEIALYKHGADSRLRESERRHAATLSSIGDAVISTDRNGAVSFLNSVAEQLTGWHHDEAIGRRLTDVFRTDDRDSGPAHQTPSGAAVTHRSGQGDTLADQATLIARDGSKLPISFTRSPIIGDERQANGIVLVFRDLTIKRQLEEELRVAQAELARSSRLTTMGELAVSIAHRINQPLAAIVTNASAGLNFLQHTPPNLEEARQTLADILNDGSRAGAVIRSMQTLARKDGPDLARICINEVLRKVLTLCQGELQRHDIVLQTHLAAQDVCVLADRVQMEQLMLNLILNAIEAMHGVTGRARTLTLSTWANSTGAVVVLVEDAGTGIDAAHADHLFESFFTTKENGMGIGLSICRSIVETHGGNLSSSPRSPHGTAFRFDLPIAACA